MTLVSGSRQTGRVLLGTLAVLLILAGVVGAQAWVIARVNFFIGDAAARKPESEDWASVALQQPLFTGDFIRTGKESRLELRMGEKDIIRIDEESEVEISNRSLNAWKGSGTKAQLKKGKIWSNVRKLVADRENLTVETPTVLAAIRGTVFRFDVPDVDTTVLRVYEGSVEVRDNPAPPPGPGGLNEVAPPGEIPPPAEVTPQQWLQIVTANQQLTVTRGQPPAVTAFDPTADALIEWVQWNRQRDTITIPPDHDEEPR